MLGTLSRIIHFAMGTKGIPTLRASQGEPFIPQRSLLRAPSCPCSSGCRWRGSSWGSPRWTAVPPSCLCCRGQRMRGRSRPLRWSRRRGTRLSVRATGGEGFPPPLWAWESQDSPGDAGIGDEEEGEGQGGDRWAHNKEQELADRRVRAGHPEQRAKSQKKCGRALPSRKADRRSRRVCARATALLRAQGVAASQRQSPGPMTVV